MTPRVVLDTNIVVSGLLWHGTERKFLDAARAGAISLYTSDALLAELVEVLPRKKLASEVSPSRPNIASPAKTGQSFGLVTPRWSCAAVTAIP